MFATHTRLLALAAALVTPAVFAAGNADAENGKTIFEQRCKLCHSASNEPGGPVMGPTLFGVTGRKAGTDKEFVMYTTAMKEFGEKWDVKTLDKFLANPFTTVPGTSMPTMLPDEKERADVVAYIATLK